MLDVLQPGERLYPGGYLISPNGRAAITLQDDGNFVMYATDSGKPLWSSKTNGSPVASAIMQEDGNVVLVRADESPVWATATEGHPGAALHAQDDGNIVLVGEDARAVWATDTYGFEAHAPSGGFFDWLGGALAWYGGAWVKLQAAFVAPVTVIPADSPLRKVTDYIVDFDTALVTLGIAVVTTQDFHAGSKFQHWADEEIRDAVAKGLAFLQDESGRILMGQPGAPLSLTAFDTSTIPNPYHSRIRDIANHFAPVTSSASVYAHAADFLSSDQPPPPPPDQADDTAGAPPPNALGSPVVIAAGLVAAGWALYTFRHRLGL